MESKKWQKSQVGTAFHPLAANPRIPPAKSPSKHGQGYLNVPNLLPSTPTSTETTTLTTQPLTTQSPKMTTDNAPTTTSSSGVDETPLSPTDSQQSLEKHLQMRPEAQDLKNRNILHDTNAAPSVSLFLSFLLDVLFLDVFLLGVGLEC